MSDGDWFIRFMSQKFIKCRRYSTSSDFGQKNETIDNGDWKHVIFASKKTDL